VEERQGEKVISEQEIMVVLADGGGGDGDNSNVRKKGPIYLSLFPASRKNDILLFFLLLNLWHYFLANNT
jgi:hypothetical protein